MTRVCLSSSSLYARYKNAYTSVNVSLFNLRVISNKKKKKKKAKKNQANLRGDLNEKNFILSCDTREKKREICQTTIHQCVKSSFCNIKTITIDSQFTAVNLKNMYFCGNFPTQSFDCTSNKTSWKLLKQFSIIHFGI